jgi:hypothetical protein
VGRPRPTPTASCAAPSTCARLDEQPTQFEPERYAAQRDAVLALWHAVFGLTGQGPARPLAGAERPAGGGRGWPGGLPAAWLDWQPALGLAEPWRAWSAAWVHWSPLHLGSNLLAAAVVAAFGWAARMPPRAALAWRRPGR